MFLWRNYNLKELVSALVNETEAVGLCPASTRILESFVEIICAYLLRSERTIDTKDYRRLKQSFQLMAISILKFESDDASQYDYVKYHIDRLMCKLVGDSNYPPDTGGWKDVPLFKGSVNRIIRQALIRKDNTFIYSLQKGTKACWLPPGKVKLAKVMDKHEKAFTRPLEPLPFEVEDIFRSTIRKIFNPKNLGPRVKLCPSSSASFMTPRKKGGTASLFAPLSVTKTGLGRLFDINTSLCAYRQDTYTEALLGVRDLSQTPLGLLDLTAARIADVVDPAKYRLVTCHDPSLNTALQPLQGQLLHAWKLTPYNTMKLSGLRPWELDCTDKVNEIHNNMKDLEFWISGDYSAATDMLNKSTGWFFCDELRAMGVDDWEIAYASLIGGFLFYPEISEKVKGQKPKVIRESKFVLGTNGQPMGSVLSFPILCAVNLAAYHHACKQYFSVHQDRDLYERMRRYVLVNGDDILFKANLEFYEIWKHSVGLFGFILSQGKNYASKTHAYINSQLFMVKGEHHSSIMKRYGYMNLGMVFGMEDGMVSNPTQLAQGLNDMFRLCPWSTACLKQVQNRYDSRYGWFRPNWFIPIELGGLGINPKFALKPIKYTLNQRKVATRFLFSPALSLYRKISSETDRVGNVQKLIHTLQILLKRSHMIPSDLDYVEGPHESSLDESGWVEKICMANYLMNPSASCGDESVYKNKVLKMKRTVNPMNVDTINRYWHPRWYSSRLPPAPPPNLIHPVSDEQISFIREFYNREPRHLISIHLMEDAVKSGELTADQLSYELSLFGDLVNSDYGIL